MQSSAEITVVAMNHGFSAEGSTTARQIWTIVRSPKMAVVAARYVFMASKLAREGHQRAAADEQDQASRLSRRQRLAEAPHPQPNAERDA